MDSSFQRQLVVDEEDQLLIGVDKRVSPFVNDFHHRREELFGELCRLPSTFALMIWLITHADRIALPFPRARHLPALITLSIRSRTVMSLVVRVE